ncbi:MAG: hypothetical protein LBI12_03880 [Treponema sp.]|jgi:hypothetical protein|nr:hypothetical protein [Treponema sp.]
MKISNIKAMRKYLYQNSGFTRKTVNSVIKALGYPLNGSGGTFNELSSEFENCALHGADAGFGGFIYYYETIKFFKTNQKDIANHLENSANELGIDIFTMVQGFGVFRNSEKPIVNHIGKALWGNSKIQPELTSLYNVFAWYDLEEVSRTWYSYLEDNKHIHTQGVDELCCTL